MSTSLHTPKSSQYARPCGTSAITSIGSGAGNSRIGRRSSVVGAAAGSSAVRATIGSSTTARSGMRVFWYLLRSTEMLWFTNFLSRTEYGFVTKNEERDVNPEFRALLMALRDDFWRLGVDVTAIESRTNI